MSKPDVSKSAVGHNVSSLAEVCGRDHIFSRDFLPKAIGDSKTLNGR